ncbi:MAG: site-2 protease family protein, partial [Saprospiraceae bacterium]
MRGSHKIARIAGIDVKVHWTFLIILAWYFFSFYRETSQVESGLYGIGFVVAVFVCVLAHEFGHSLMARRFGVRTRDITLLPIGGIASLERIPEKPREELAVALAGPAVNVLIAVALYIYMAATGNLVDLSNYLETFSLLDPANFVENIFAINLGLFIFNLIPAFPMDGGRVLRALLAMRWDRAKATRFAAGIGRTLAVGFVFMGFFGNFWLVFIGLFIYLGATAESRQVLTKSILEGYKVGAVLMTNYTPLYVHEPLQRAVDLLLSGQEKEFLVLDIEGIVVGVLTRESLVQALATGEKNMRVKDAALATPLELHKQMPLQEAFELMMSAHATVCPVYDGQKLA